MPHRNQSRWIAFVLLMALSVVAGWFLLQREREEVPPVPETDAHRQVRKAVLHNVSTELINEVLRIEAQERRIAETVWAKEMLAQECGRTIERLWDTVNAANNKLGVIAGFAVGEVQFGKWDRVEELPHKIRFFQSSGAAGVLSGDQWSGWLNRVMKEGWVLEQIEFRHNQFNVDAAGQPSHSRFSFAANLLNERRGARVSFEGDLDVQWDGRNAEGVYGVKKADASRLVIKARTGEPLFQLVCDGEIFPQGQSKAIDPLLVYDLDGDDHSEIIMAAPNLVYRLKGAEAVGRDLQWKFEIGELCKHPEEYIGTALLADVTSDGAIDFVCAKWEGVFVFEGSRAGSFENKARLAWKSPQPIQKAMVLTCGDIEGDGDLDLFLGQYKDPYEGGATPTPFYDANDGYPAYLLINSGKGEFEDATEKAGLAAKRLRRTFSASFVDLDRDEDLDLMVVSDFAGADFYRNDGSGRFTDVTRNSLGVSQAFGMAHSFADFNRDGVLDVLMIGMTSPTMDRLTHAGLKRSEDPHERAMELRMASGNRLLLGRKSGGFEQTHLSDSVARSGWAWGCAKLDFDDDGFEDLYVGNGFQSKETVADSEGDYWLHDRFLQSTFGTSATDLYFKSTGARNRGAERSFGGNERNRFYWNRGGANFVEIGYLLGVSLQEDSRNVVADDLDGDGRMDLVMTTQEMWSKQRQTLKVYKNGLGMGEKSAKRVSGIGGNVVDAAVSGEEIGKVWEKVVGGSKTVDVYVTGDGFRSQGPARGKREGTRIGLEVSE